MSKYPEEIKREVYACVFDRLIKYVEGFFAHTWAIYARESVELVHAFLCEREFFNFFLSIVDKNKKKFPSEELLGPYDLWFGPKKKEEPEEPEEIEEKLKELEEEEPKEEKPKEKPKEEDPKEEDPKEEPKKNLKKNLKKKKEESSDSDSDSDSD